MSNIFICLFMLLLILSMSSPELFKIRGHHLTHFAAYERNGWSPNEIASKQTASIRKDTRDSYIYDVLGNNEETEAKFELAYSKVFKQYAELRPHDPILITVGERDGICDSCVLGQHCKTSGFILAKGRTSPYFLKGTLEDMDAVKRFTYIAAALALTKKIDYDNSIVADDSILITTEERATYATAITTAAGYVKDVLKFWRIEQFKA